MEGQTKEGKIHTIPYVQGLPEIFERALSGHRTYKNDTTNHEGMHLSLPNRRHSVQFAVDHIKFGAVTPSGRKPSTNVF